VVWTLPRSASMICSLDSSCATAMRDIARIDKAMATLCRNRHTPSFDRFLPAFSVQ